MSDYSISSVSSVSAVVRTQEAQPAAPQTGVMPAFPLRAERGERPDPVVAGQKQGLQTPAALDPTAPKPVVQKAAEQKAAVDAQEKKALPINNMDSVMIRFSVDEKTKNITVYVIDKVSKRVVRAIPPEDLNKMQAGDLLQLLA